MGERGVMVILDTTSTPCADDVTLPNWSPLGSSIGVALDYDDDVKVWVSISDLDSTYDKQNLGAAWRTNPPGSTIVRDYHPGSAHPAAKPVDVIGNYPYVVVAEKEGATLEQWDVTGGSGTVYTHSNATGVTQLEWLDGDYFVATLAGTVGELECGDNDSQHGYLWLSQLDETSPVVSEEVIHPGLSTRNTKPEGVDTLAWSSYANDTCASAQSGIDYVVYVGDFCRNFLWVYGVDTQSGYEDIELITGVNLDGASGLSGVCNPSSVRYHSGEDIVYVLCQTGDSIIALDVSDDLCDPEWIDEVRLQHTDGGPSPSCGVRQVRVDCDGAGECQPHDIAYDDSIANGWLFINLTHRPSLGEGEILVIDTDLDNQYILYRGSDYVPMELELQSL